MIDKRWFEIWRFPFDVSLDIVKMKQLNEQLFTYTGTLNIRDNFFVLARVTANQRISILARKCDANPILKIITNSNLRNEEVGDENEDSTTVTNQSSRISTPIRSWKEMVTIA